ncbi:MAG TPA: response regulator [Polyangiaceae bacterium]|nr:response regulator [Polyangiaceae bacterium]
MPPAAATVLVVEDEFAALEVMALLLEAHGYRALMAADGQEAMETLLKEPVELVITDYMMPRMNGVALCKAMNREEKLQHIPVIMISANRPQEVGPAPQVVAFFGKPLLFDDLKAAVQRLIGPGAGADGAAANTDQSTPK